MRAQKFFFFFFPPCEGGEVLIIYAFAFRWDAFVPLHRLWLGYMSELLGLVTEVYAQARGKGLEQGQTAPAMKTAMPMAAGMHAKLVKADFHGSIMTGRFPLSCLVRETVIY